MATCLVRLALTYNRVDQPGRAAKLLGAADAALKLLGTPLPSFDLPHFDTAVREARSALEAAEFDAAWSKGSSGTLEDAVADELPVAVSPQPILP
jgi:hypothetical protein